MIVAIGIFNQYSLTAGFFYMIHHVIVIASLFLIAGIMIKKTKTSNINEMGGLWKSSPMLGIAFLIQSLALTGIPPLSGFWGKLMLLKVGLEQSETLAIIAIIIASILTLLSMVKIWFHAFCTPVDSKSESLIHPTKLQISAITILIVSSLTIGLHPNPMIVLAKNGIQMAQNKSLLQQEVQAVPVVKKVKEDH
tara:strand:- start:251 stop:832 length:582 start_codon:yes stop_codon:yes gene_type:complete